ncbi:MAG TPA: hypothetical protein VH120_11905 [Gemmataceae bacterium]|jgi:hypothetical protein|nr:hypothetical protein [Gemmataceae bacterium]
MAARFHEDGISFRYPENWALEREDHDSGWTVSVQSPDTAFLIVTFDGEAPDVAQMADSALDTLRTEYEGLEAEPKVESIAGQPAVGHDVRFFSFDLTNTAGIRSFRSEGGTVLVLWQFNDLEQEQSEPVLKAICASIQEE